ncbi:hypothetical protein G3480_20530 [Thiorhodococcus mannitoliphagus]|uniref:Growth inhibitor PemK n=1 Tax=Thiorhodococcus mannitoliphagus TaxID=329406 RepID=A0A6P1E052_9GAMM|nr:hypothetical protein [Thiorhodococcus mannitoliphagus]NEX22663.1 hypothetical protein [Thiorhodococcus mannitoliphagus]
MPLPTPVPSLVIRYAYLWRAEQQRGHEEGRKDRPRAVILVTTDDHGDPVVTVLPVTHTPPSDPSLAVEIPHATKRRLGLDDDRSWIVLTEANRFVWPGPDLRPTVSGDATTVAYGLLPRTLFKDVITQFHDLVVARQASLVRRTE